jgi:hypothetical protein
VPVLDTASPSPIVYLPSPDASNTMPRMPPILPVSFSGQLTSHCPPSNVVHVDFREQTFLTSSALSLAITPPSLMGEIKPTILDPSSVKIHTDACMINQQDTLKAASCRTGKPLDGFCIGIS